MCSGEETSDTDRPECLIQIRHCDKKASLTSAKTFCGCAPIISDWMHRMSPFAAEM